MLEEPEKQRFTASRGREWLAGVTASGCWECGGAEPPPLVFALGRIGFDFGSQARRDSFVQMGVADPEDPVQLLAYLDRHPAHSSALTWTLEQENDPVYAIQPGGAFAAETYTQLRRLLSGQTAERIEIVSIPGTMAGQRTLGKGRTVPVVWPHIRGVRGWRVSELVAAVLGEERDPERDAGRREAAAMEVASFLERFYHELRNPGQSPQDRAVNFVATQGPMIEQIYQPALRAGLRLSAIEATRSLLCRPASDCWDVRLIFFDPKNRLERARQIFQVTVDVSEVLPVALGKLHGWEAF